MADMTGPANDILGRIRREPGLDKSFANAISGRHSMEPDGSPVMTASKVREGLEEIGKRMIGLQERCANLHAVLVGDYKTAGEPVGPMPDGTIFQQLAAQTINLSRQIAICDAMLDDCQKVLR